MGVINFDRLQKKSVLTAMTITTTLEHLTEPPLTFKPLHKSRLAQDQAKLDNMHNDARTGVPLGIPRGAICVQRFDESLSTAVHITYRISLRSSSMPEPRDPLLKVLLVLNKFSDIIHYQNVLTLVVFWASKYFCAFGIKKSCPPLG